MIQSGRPTPHQSSRQLQMMEDSKYGIQLKIQCIQLFSISTNKSSYQNKHKIKAIRGKDKMKESLETMIKIQLEQIRQEEEVLKMKRIINRKEKRLMDQGIKRLKIRSHSRPLLKQLLDLIEKIQLLSQAIHQELLTSIVYLAQIMCKFRIKIKLIDYIKLFIQMNQEWLKDQIVEKMKRSLKMIKLKVMKLMTSLKKIDY